MEDVNVRELVGECGDDSTTGVSLLQCREQWPCATRVLSISAASKLTLSGTIGRPTGVKVSYVLIEPMAWSTAVRSVGEAKVA